MTHPTSCRDIRRGGHTAQDLGIPELGMPNIAALTEQFGFFI